MYSDWFNGIEILQGRWQHGEKVGYCYPSGLEKTVSKGDIYVPLGHLYSTGHERVNAQNMEHIKLIKQMNWQYKTANPY